MPESDLSDIPTAEEFKLARSRELARLHLRMSSTLGRPCHTPEDEALLHDDTPYKRAVDMEVVRRWTANRVTSGKKPASKDP